jgi:predicted DNA-binding transcriptional regulator YafY
MEMMAKSGRSTGDPVQNVTQGAGPKSQPRAARILALIRTLERDRKIRKAEAFALAGVGSQSSFKRIKHELAAMGLPLNYNFDDGYYHLPAAASIARYGIDTRTRADLAQVRASVGALGGIEREALESILDVLEARIALEDPEAVAVVTSRHPQPRGGREFYDALDRALTAVREHRWLSFTYERTAGGERTPRTIAPYAVHAHDGRYYVWGTLEGDAAAFPAPRLFALDRMSEVALEEDTFAVDPTLDLGDALRYSFGTMVSTEPPQDIVVRIAPEAAAFVACRTWPAERERATDQDGSLRLTFELSRPDEIVAWVLSFGGGATIESPPSAREELRRRAQLILEASD